MDEPSECKTTSVTFLKAALCLCWWDWLQLVSWHVFIFLALYQITPATSPQRRAAHQKKVWQLSPANQSLSSLWERHVRGWGWEKATFCDAHSWDQFLAAFDAHNWVGTCSSWWCKVMVVLDMRRWTMKVVIKMVQMLLQNVDVRQYSWYSWLMLLMLAMIVGCC